jgi:catechol 2,3-dioxygenase-like lactoylglutathione lyase family enzyme
VVRYRSDGLKTGNIATAHGSMNHVAFNIPLEKVEDYRTKLVEKGVEVTPILHHADVETGYVPELDENTFISSFYFFDPNGILLEFAANVRPLGNPAQDLQHKLI